MCATIILPLMSMISFYFLPKTLLSEVCNLDILASQITNKQN